MVCNQQNWKSCLELKKIYDADVTMTTLCDVTVTQFNGKQFYFRKAYLWQVLVIMINILFKTRFFDVLSITQFDILRVSDKCLKIQLILTDIIFNILKNVTFKSMPFGLLVLWRGKMSRVKEWYNHEWNIT